VALIKLKLAYRVLPEAANKEKIIISNRDRYPDVNFFDENDIRIIGKGVLLAYLEKEEGTNAVIVAEVKGGGSLFAVPLHELMVHTYGSIEITEELD
jgi:hypothetical protein